MVCTTTILYYNQDIKIDIMIIVFCFYFPKVALCRAYQISLKPPN